MRLFHRFRRGENPRGKDSPVRLTPTEARQGVTPQATRYVLSCGLTLVILAFSLVYFIL